MKKNILQLSDNNNLLEKELKNNQKKYLDHVFECFKNKIVLNSPLPDTIRVFSFENTELQVVVKSIHFLPNLKNLLEQYIKMEEYEKCKTLTDLIEYIEKNSNMNTK
jgi:hypothetical protein